MLAIETRFIGPTDKRGSRYVAAVCERKRDGMPVRKLTVHADDRLDSEDNHKAAAIALIRTLGWTGDWIMAGTDPGYVFVCDTRHEYDHFTVTLNDDTAHASA